MIGVVLGLVLAAMLFLAGGISGKGNWVRELRARYELGEIDTPFELAQRYGQSGRLVDGSAHRLICQLYPGTAHVQHPGDGLESDLMFSEIRLLGTAPIDDEIYSLVLVRRTIWHMLSPRGQEELLLVTNEGELLDRSGMFMACDRFALRPNGEFEYASRDGVLTLDLHDPLVRQRLLDGRWEDVFWDDPHGDATPQAWVVVTQVPDRE